MVGAANRRRPWDRTLSDCASAQLVVSLTDANGSAVPGATYLIVSTADSVATVSTAGLVAARGQGAATIVVGSRGRLVNVPVSVRLGSRAVVANEAGWVDFIR